MTPFVAGSGQDVVYLYILFHLPSTSIQMPEVQRPLTCLYIHPVLMKALMPNFAHPSISALHQMSFHQYSKQRLWLTKEWLSIDSLLIPKLPLHLSLAPAKLNHLPLCTFFLLNSPENNLSRCFEIGLPALADYLFNGC